MSAEAIAALPRDFVLEWLGAPWKESRTRSKRRSRRLGYHAGCSRASGCRISLAPSSIGRGSVLLLVIGSLKTITRSGTAPSEELDYNQLPYNPTARRARWVVRGARCEAGGRSATWGALPHTPHPVPRTPYLALLAVGFSQSPPIASASNPDRFTRQ